MVLVDTLLNCPSRLLMRQLKGISTSSRERGFDITVDSAHVDARATAFVTGAQAGLRGGDFGSVHERLAEIPANLRGFAYEGAGMTAHLLDSIVPGRRWRVRLLLGGPGYRYRYLVHVGVGWGMARLRQSTPREAWGLDPLLRWLALDGVGFHRVYFARAAERRSLIQRPVRSAAQHIVKQGMGRALWFVHGADQRRIAEALEPCGDEVQDALWRGIGLAGEYAGGTQFAPKALLAAAGRHAPAVRQGLRFGLAAKHAHVLAGTLDAQRAAGDARECSVFADDAAVSLTTHNAAANCYRQWQYEVERAEL